MSYARSILKLSYSLFKEMGEKNTQTKQNKHRVTSKTYNRKRDDNLPVLNHLQ